MNFRNYNWITVQIVPFDWTFRKTKINCFIIPASCEVLNKSNLNGLSYSEVIMKREKKITLMIINNSIVFGCISIANCISCRKPINISINKLSNCRERISHQNWIATIQVSNPLENSFFSRILYVILRNFFIKTLLIFVLRNIFGNTAFLLEMEQVTSASSLRKNEISIALLVNVNRSVKTKI